MARPLTISNFGATRDLTVKKVDLSSLNFNGVDSKLEIAATADLALGTSDFTIEFWTYLDSSTPNNHRFLNLTNGTQTVELIYDYSGFSIRRIYFALNNLPPNQDVEHQSNVDIVAGVWIHVCVERENGIIRLYLDGDEKDSADNNIDSNTIGADLAGSYELYIGVQSDDTNYFDGRIDNLRISKVARYKGNFTPRVTRYGDDLDTVLIVEDDDPALFGSLDRTEPKIAVSLTSSTALTCAGDSFPNLHILDDYTWDQTASWDQFNGDQWIQGYRFPTVEISLLADGEVGNPVDGSAQLLAFTPLLVAGDSTESVTGSALLHTIFSLTSAAGTIQTAQTTLELFGFQVSAAEVTAPVLGDATLSSEFDLSILASADRLANCILASVSNIEAQADVTEPVLGTAALTISAFKVTTAISETAITGDVLLQSQFDITAVPEIVLVGSATLAAFNDINVTAGFSRLGQIDLDLAFNMHVQGATTVDGRCQLTSEFELQSLGGLLVQVDDPYVYTWDSVPEDQWNTFVGDRWDPRGFVIFNTVELSADAIKAINGQCAAVASTDLISTGGLLVDGIIKLDFEFDIIPISINFKTADSSLQFSAALQAQAIVEANAASELVCETDLESDAVVTESITAQASLEIAGFNLAAGESTASITGTAVLAVQSNIVAQASVEVNAAADLAAFVLSVSAGEKTASITASAELFCTFQQICTGTRLVKGLSDLIIASNLQADGAVEINASARLDAFGFVFADSEAFGPVLAETNLFDQIDLSVDAQVDISAKAVLAAFVFKVSDGESTPSIPAQVEINTVFDMAVAADVAASISGELSLASIFDINVEGQLLLLPSRYVVYVDAESRKVLVKSETRIQPVSSENRTLDLQEYET